MREYGVQMEAWSPLGHGGDVLLDEVLADIAGKYGKTVAQIILKWDIRLMADLTVRW